LDENARTSLVQGATEDIMSQDGGNGRDGQTPRDFLALAHAQEWTNFYDSFDKLVQDNLARSSELLRHAMSLPEVADREVAEMKAEMATKIAAERQAAKEALTLVHKDLVSTQEQGEALQRSMISWMADLGRVSQSVADLVQKYDEHDDVPAAEAVAPEPEPVGAVWESPAEPAVEAEAEPESDVLASSAEAADEAVWDGDVSFDELVSGESTADDADDEGDSSPQKPAWLSVARQGATS
jgi:hypothetical protein